MGTMGAAGAVLPEIDICNDDNTKPGDKRTKLWKTVPDKEFWVNGRKELCQSTGMKVRFEGEFEWWYEYQAENGELYYGK
jgi:hypothetical protein